MAGNDFKPLRHGNDERFWVKALRDIQTARRVIPQGADVLIDPSITPSEGRTVLVGNDLVSFRGQTDVRGVAVQIEFDVD